jgi:hypothetical protein
LSPSDPRGLIYNLGMAGIETKASSAPSKKSKSKPEVKAPAVDYDKPIERLLMDIEQYLSSTTSPTEVLLDVENSAPCERRNRLPSWVSDWTKLREWISDPESQLRVQETLKAVSQYHKLLRPYQYLKKSIYTWVTERPPIPIDADISRSRPLFEGWRPPTTGKDLIDANSTERVYISIFMENLLDLKVCFKENPPQDLPYQIALLGYGLYAPVSHLVRVCDVVCSLGAHDGCFLLRTRKQCQLDADQNRIIRQDFEKHKAFKGFDDTIPKV